MDTDMTPNHGADLSELFDQLVVKNVVIPIKNFKLGGSYNFSRKSDDISQLKIQDLIDNLRVTKRLLHPIGATGSEEHPDIIFGWRRYGAVSFLSNEDPRFLNIEVRLFNRKDKKPLTEAEKRILNSIENFARGSASIIKLAPDIRRMVVEKKIPIPKLAELWGLPVKQIKNALHIHDIDKRYADNVVPDSQKAPGLITDSHVVAIGNADRSDSITNKQKESLFDFVLQKTDEVVQPSDFGKMARAIKSVANAEEAYNLVIKKKKTMKKLDINVDKIKMVKLFGKGFGKHGGITLASIIESLTRESDHDDQVISKYKEELRKGFLIVKKETKGRFTPIQIEEIITV